MRYRRTGGWAWVGTGDRPAQVFHVGRNHAGDWLLETMEEATYGWADVGTFPTAKAAREAAETMCAIECQEALS